MQILMLDYLLLNLLTTKIHGMSYCLHLVNLTSKVFVSKLIYKILMGEW